MGVPIRVCVWSLKSRSLAPCSRTETERQDMISPYRRRKSEAADCMASPGSSLKRWTRKREAYSRRLGGTPERCSSRDDRWESRVCVAPVAGGHVGVWRSGSNAGRPTFRARVTGRLHRASGGFCAPKTFERSPNSHPYSHPYNASNLQGFDATRTDGNPHQRSLAGLLGRLESSYTIFEGTSEIQRLVIARAISGIHIQ